MNMVLDPTNSAVDRVRLRIADFSDTPILSDTEIQYYITKNNGNENLATKETALVILGVLARNSSYNKIDVLIVDGRYAYDNYKDYLLLMVKDPSLSLVVPNSYFGGVSLADMLANDSNPDNNLRPSFSTTIENSRFLY